MWEELTALGGATALRWHFILTVRRDTELDAHPIHADTIGGTMACFALLSTKVPTPICPRDVFEPPALARSRASRKNRGGPLRPTR